SVPKRLELPDLQPPHHCRHRDPKSTTRPAYPQRNPQGGKRHEARKHGRIGGKIVGCRPRRTLPAKRADLHAAQPNNRVCSGCGEGVSVARPAELRRLETSVPEKVQRLSLLRDRG